MAKTLKVGLALGSGGPRGFALIGVIRVLHKNKIPIDFIAGTSAGAIVGGAYAISRNLSKLESLVSSFPFKELIKILLEVNFNGGLVKGENLRSFAKEQFGNTKIEKNGSSFLCCCSRSGNRQGSNNNKRVSGGCNPRKFVDSNAVCPV